MFITFYYKCEIIQIIITYLRNASVEIIQISYYSNRTILSYEESARFTGTTLIDETFFLFQSEAMDESFEGQTFF